MASKEHSAATKIQSIHRGRMSRRGRTGLDDSLLSQRPNESPLERTPLEGDGAEAPLLGHRGDAGGDNAGPGFAEKSTDGARPGRVSPRSSGSLRGVLRNPVFHVKALSWIIWIVCYFFIRGPAQLSFMKVNHALERVVPLLNGLLSRTLPATMGDCSAGDAPRPCVGSTPLYEEKWNGAGAGNDVLVRWVTGMNSVVIRGVSVHVIPDSVKPIQVEVRGAIREMKMSIRIKQCFFSVCKTLWDNDDGCCPPQREFELVVATDCLSEGPDGSARLGRFKLEWFDIDPISLSESIMGLKDEVVDLTPRVRTAVREATMGIFAGDRDFLNMTFAEVVARLWKYNTMGRGRCKDLLDTSW